MPSWKKVVASGSDASFSSLTVDTYVSASSFNGSFTGSLQGTSSQAISSSYALTASYALFAANGGGGGVSAIYILDEGVVQGTASYFDFTGAGVTATVNNQTASIYIPGGGGGSNTNSQNAILSQTSPAVTWSFTHNLSTLYPVFTIYDNEDNVIIPQKIHAETTASAFIYFSSARTGTAVASKGGDITSASFAATASLANFATSASYSFTASSAISSSLAQTASYVVTAQTASYVLNAVSASYAFTASSAINASTSLIAVSASQAATASSADTFLVRNDITASNALITGTITAQTLVVQTVTSSIVYSSGSNRFGSQLTDRQTFTGSVDITGSLSVNGSEAILTNQTASMAVASAISASYALNGGVTQILAGANVTIAPTSGKGQVTISATGGGGSNFNTATGSYGSFYDTTTQTNPVANTPRSMSFNTTDITNGVSISGSTSPFNTYIKTENPGVYDIQFSAQLDKTDAGKDEIIIWLRKNGTDLTDTATSISLTNNNDKVVAAWNWFVNSAANDYYQIIWYSADPDLRILAETAGGGHPGIPSVIATVNRVDQFLSNSGSFSGSFSGALTGSLFGTASWAENASTASYVTTAQTASYVLNAVSSSYAYTASSAINSSASLTSISASYSYTASSAISASLAQTASYVVTAQTASYVENAISSSYAYTASSSVSSSYAYTASSAINASASLTSVSASYALTASFALNGGGGGLSALYIADEGITQGTASYLDFTGAAVTATVSNGTASINVTGGSNSGQTTNFTQSVAAATWTFTHNLNTRTPLVQVYDTSYNQIVPQFVSSSNVNTILITFGIATAGYAVASTGGTIIVTGSNIILNQTTPATTWSFQHNLNYQYPVFQIYGSSDEVIIPQAIIATDATSSLIYFPTPVSGKAVASVGGVSGSMLALSASYAYTASSAISASYASFASTASYATNFTASNILVNGTITAQTLIVQTVTSSIVYSSGSNIFGSALTDTQTFTGSLNITGSAVNLKDGTFSGSGANLFGIPATGITGLNLSQISSGSVSASISPNQGLLINTSVSASNFTGSFTGSLTGIATSASYASFALTASYSLGGSGFPYSGSAVITGSFLVSQSFVDFSNASYFSGSLTGSLYGTASYATFALSCSFAPGFTTNMSQSVAATTWSFTHNLNTINPIVQVYDLTNSQIVPNQIVGMNNSTAEIRFTYAQDGYAVASNGGGLYVTGSTSTLVQTVGAVTWSFTHNLNNKYNTYEVYDSNDYVLIPSAIKAVDNNNVELHFATSQTGKAVAQFSGINGAPNATTASYALTATSSSYAATASYLNPITNSYVVLTQVSQSLNFVDDAAAEAGGVPLGGIYRNGNFILIRLS